MIYDLLIDSTLKHKTNKLKSDIMRFSSRLEMLFFRGGGRGIIFRYLHYSKLGLS